MVKISNRSVELKKIISILLLFSISSCQLITKPAVNDLDNGFETKQTTISTDDYPPLLLTLDPESGTTIRIRQKFNFEFSEEMDKKSVEAAFQMNPLVSGSFEWIDGKSVSFEPDQELPVGQNISLEIKSNATNIAGVPLGKSVKGSFQVAEPLRVGYKYPVSGQNDVDTNSNSVFVTFNQPVVENLSDAAILSPAFRIIPDQDGYGQWINNSTYMYFLDHGLTGGTDFRVEINRNLKSVNGSVLEISSNSNWHFTTIEPGILQYSPSMNSTIPLDQSFTLIFNQSMQTETVAANFLFHDMSGQPVSGRFYWNDLDTEMTFIPEKILKRGTTYLMELLPGSQVKGGNIFSQELSVSYTTIQEFFLESTIPANQQPINIINGKSSLILVFSSELLITDFSNLITVYPEVLDLEIKQRKLKNELEISGSMEAGQTYKVLISNSVKDRWGSVLSEAILNEYYISPPEPELIFQNVVGDNMILVDTDKQVLNADVTNMDQLKLILTKLEFSEFAAFETGQSLELQNNKPTVLQFNTNALPNREKTIEIELEQFNTQLSPGIYSLEIESNTDYTDQFFILIQHTKLFSKISENQLLIWAPYSSSKLSIDDHPLTIYDDLFEVIIATKADSVGVKIIEPFLYGRENSNYWIEYGKPGDLYYSLLYSGWQANGDEIGIDQDASIFAYDIESFFISDQNIYQPGDTIHFYTVLRSFINDEFIIPDVNTYQFFLRKIDSGFTISEQEIVMSEFGTLNGELQIPENLTDGLYEIGFDSDFDLSKQIYIDKRSINYLNFSVNFNSDKYKIGNDLSFIIETLSNNIIETDGIPIKWSIEFVSIEDSLESSDVFNSMPILNQSNILMEDTGNLGNSGKYLVEIKGNEIANLLPSREKPYLLIVKVEIFSNEFLPHKISSECTLYPERYLIEIETNSFYESNPESIPIQIYSKNWDQKMIGAINVNILLQKAITGKTNNENDKWGDLNKANLRTDGNGFGEYEAFINGPGIYRIAFQSGNLKIVRIFYVGGEGKIQYPIALDGNLPIILEKSNFSIGETAKIFIPNPFNNPAILLLTLERNHVLSYEVVRIEENFLIYELQISEDLGQNVFLSILMIDENNNGQISGIAQINVNSEQKHLTINVEIERKEDSGGNLGTIDFWVKDFNGTPVQAELYIKASNSDFSPVAYDAIFQNLYHYRPDLVKNNYIGNNDIGLKVLNEAIIKTYEDNSNNMTNQTIWIREILTDENGHGSIDVVFPYESLNILLQVDAISQDLRIGRNITQLPTGFTASIGTHVPHFVTRGDEFILGLELTNLLEFPQTISIDLVKQDLQIIDVLTKEITLGVGEAKKVSWQVLANKEGIETINFRIKNPAGKTIEITRDILVKQLPKFDFNVINGSATVAGEDEYFFGIVNKNSYVDGLITTYIIPNLSSSLMAGTEKINLESLSIEQKAWTLLAILHIEEMVQVSGSVEETIKEKLSQQAQELVQSLLLTQNIDGGWSKIVGYASDPTITAFSSWALKLSENFFGKVSRESLNLAMDYMINNMGSPDSFEEVSQFDQLAILTFVVKLLDSEKVNPVVLLPFLESFSNEGKIFLSLALEIDNRGNDQSRTIIKDIERNTSIENGNLIIENDGLLLNNLNTFTSQMALEIYALSIIDPASAILNEAIQLIMNAQKAPGQWANILESRVCLMAISKYIIGTGQTNGNYEYQAYLNDREILEGSNTSINFLSPISSEFVISQNEPDLIYNQKFSRTEGAGTLFYMTLISVNKLPQQISSRDSGFTIQRFYYLDENTNNLSDCYKGLCYGDNLTVVTNRNQPVQVLLIITTSKDQLNVTLEEHLPAGVTLIENSLQENFSTNNYYQPIIDYSKNDIHYQSHSYDAIKWFSEELPAGTYVVSYLINPEFIGQFSMVPANIWARFESINPSWSKGQLLTIINN